MKQQIVKEVGFLPKDGLEIITFESLDQWERWLAKNHAKSNGIWLRIFKKNSSTRTISYAEALDGALCYGWIDGQKDKYDAYSWLQRFTPRRPKSIWSKRNIEHIERLIKVKKIKIAGLREIEKAKEDGRWSAAYDSPSNSEVPDDFLKALARNKKAKAFFDTLNKANLYSITWRLQTAKKSETREKRMKAIIEQLAQNIKFNE